MRPVLQSHIRATLQSEQAALPGGGADTILGAMLEDIAKATAAATAISSSAPASGKGKKNSAVQHKLMVQRVLENGSLQKMCESFVTMNNDKKIANQPAYSRFLTAIKRDILSCSCDPEAWDPEPCHFHEGSSHTISDFVWGISNAIKVMETVPAAIPILGCGSMLHLQAEIDDFRARKAKAEAAKEDFTEKEPCALALFGKAAKFMLKDITTNDKRQGLNDTLVSFMITARVRYMLDAARHLMCRPKKSQERQPAFVTFTDCDVNSLRAVVNMLCSESEGVQEFLMEAEAAFYMGPAGLGRDCSDEWAAAWAKVLRSLVQKVQKPEGDNNDYTISPALLPAAAKIFGLSHVKDEEVDAKTGAPQATSAPAHQVDKLDKDKSDKGKDKEENDAFSSFAAIYNLCDLQNAAACKNAFHVADILHIQLEIERTLLTEVSTQP